MKSIKINFEKLSVEQDLTHMSLKDRQEFFEEEDPPKATITEFEDIFELIAFILPQSIFSDHKNFKELETTFLQLTLPEDAWLPIEVYMRKNKISRQGIYLRRDTGKVFMQKFDKVMHVIDSEFFEQK